MKMFKYIFLTLLLLCSAAAGGFTGSKLFAPQRANADDPDSLTADAYQVVDKNNNVKILIGTKGDYGHPMIYMYDDKQAVRALYTLSEASEPIISFLDKNGKVRLAAGVMKDGSPSFELSDAKEKVIWSKP